MFNKEAKPTMTTLHPAYLTATDYRAEMLWDTLDASLGLTRADLREAVESATDTVYEQSGWRPDLDNDSAWEIVLPVALVYLSDDHALDMSTFDHIAY